MNVNVEAGDLVKWCFSSLDKDIDFQVSFITKDGVGQTVFPLSRVQSKASLVAGEWRCEADGQIRLCFDNSKSSWYSCSVSYEVTVEKGSH